MFLHSRRPRTGLSAYSCALSWSCALTFSAALLSACSGEEADGMPEYDGIQGFNNAQNPAVNNSGANNTTGQTAGNNNAAANNGSGGSSSTGINTSPTPNTNPGTNTTPNTEANPSTTPINNGTNTGTNAGANNGGAMAPGAGGNGGMGTNPPVTDPNPPVTNPNPPVTDPNPPVTNPNPPVVTPSAPDIPCPAGATFCSGFESDTLPAGASYQSQPTAPLQFDTTVKHSGNRSLMVVSAGGFNIREVVAPIPGQAFWVRLFIQTSDIFGDNNHDSLFVASTANPSQDNNAEAGTEFSEQGHQFILNADDALFSQAGAGFPQGNGPQLSANTWHCVEAFYDGGSGNVQVFTDGDPDPALDAPGFKRLTYQTFRFGYIGFNTVRTVWFDDVVVSANRVNCN